ncbi:hypothetical protein [Dactylosporangium sp. NPDC050588]|uniref:hypothetical protein n=1 Tax=Dactylosporangium sp. NPDC050588 TaxID=3157211 RepID=UPI0033E1BBA1
MTMTPVRGSVVEARVGEAWSRAAGVVVRRLDEPWLTGGASATLLEVNGRERLDRLRELTSAGVYVDGIVRSLPSLEIVLRDATGGQLATIGLIGSDIIAWNRDEFGNDFELEASHELWLFLAELGVPGSLARLTGPLVHALGLEEGEERFRPVVEGSRIPAVMGARRAPQPLWSWLSGFSSEDAQDRPPTEIDRYDAELRAAMPQPGDRARSLLAWWGSLTWLSEACAGEGVLARALLSCIDRGDVLRAMGADLDAAVVMGALAWINAVKDEDGVLERIGPHLRVLPG